MRMLLWFEEMQHSTVKGFQSRAMVDARVSPRDSQPMGIGFASAAGLQLALILLRE